VINATPRVRVETAPAEPTETADRLDETREGEPSRATGEQAGGPPPCPYVRDIARANGVYPEGEIRRLSRHTAHCLTCMEEFVGLVSAAASAVPSGATIVPSR
jgi:hypothetical protein